MFTQKKCHWRAISLTHHYRCYQINISMHIDPPTSHTVHIEPLTPSDWESKLTNPLPHTSPYIGPNQLTSTTPSYRTPCFLPRTQPPLPNSCSNPLSSPDYISLSNLYSLYQSNPCGTRECTHYLSPLTRTIRENFS